MSLKTNCRQTAWNLAAISIVLLLLMGPKLTRPSGDERLEDPMFASLPGNPRSSQLELKAYGFLRG